MDKPFLLLVCRLALILLASLTSLSNAHGQTITEIIDATGDGAGHTLSNPVGVAVDGSGNIYVTGYFSHNVFKISPTGVVTEIIDSAGDGLGNSLSAPVGVAVDNSGNVYVSGRFSNNVFKITSSGVITKIIDGSGDGLGHTLGTPGQTLAIDASQNVYVTGQFSDNVFKISPSGAITQIMDATGDGLGNTLDLPLGLAVDASDNIYVTGEESDNVFKITPGGAVTEIADAAGDGTGNPLEGPYEVAVDGSDNVYVTAYSSQNAFKISPTGSITEIVDVLGDGAGNFLLGPVGIAVTGSGYVYVGGTTSSNVFEISPSGTIRQVLDATGDDVHGFTDPQGIAVDASGNVYVAGHNSHNVFKIATVPPNNPPLADAGSDQTVTAAELVLLDGSGSSDSDSDPITYLWQFASTPIGSGATLSDDSAVDPTFTADLGGVYEIEMVVNDGLADSEPDTVVVTAQSAEEAVDNVTEDIQTLVDTGGLSAGQGNSLTASLDAALDALAAGDTTTAANQLGAFINKTRAKIKSGKIDPDAGQDLLDAANSILAAIGNGKAGKRSGSAIGGPNVPSAYVLSQNYPNPFNPVTRIDFGIPEAGHVKLLVFDVLGRLVVTLLDVDMQAGNHRAAFDASALPSGAYLYRIEAGSFVESKRMVLLK